MGFFFFLIYYVYIYIFFVLVWNDRDIDCQTDNPNSQTLSTMFEVLKRIYMHITYINTQIIHFKPFIEKISDFVQTVLGKYIYIYPCSVLYGMASILIR